MYILLYRHDHSITHLVLSCLDFKLMGAISIDRMSVALYKKIETPSSIFEIKAKLDLLVSKFCKVFKLKIAQ